MLWHLGPLLFSDWGTTLQHIDTVTSYLCMDLLLFLHLVPKCLSFNVDIYSYFSLVDNAAGSDPQMCVQNALRGLVKWPSG